MDNLAFEHGGNIHQMEHKHRVRFLDFSANINPLGLPRGIKKVLHNSFDSVMHYPEIQAEGIRRAIARYWQIPVENVLIGNGSAELIYLIMQAFRPQSVAMPAPTFSEYERAASLCGVRIRFLELREEEGFVLRDCAAKTDMIFLCNPNNPTGNLLVEDMKIVENASLSVSVIDEAFMDFVPQEEKYSFVRRAQKDKKIIALRTCTKFFALAGLRIGYLVAHKDVVKKLKGFQVPWSVNFLAQRAAEEAFKDKEYIRKTRLLVEKERGFLFDAIGEINGLTPFPSVVNFLLIKINHRKLNSSLLSNRLIRERILVRDCVNFRGLNNRFIRIAVRLHNENIRLVKVLERIIA